MVKQFIRKMFGIGVEPEAKKAYIRLNYRENIIQFICSLFWLTLYPVPFIPVFIIGLCEDTEWAMSTQIAVCVSLGIYAAVFAVITALFRDVILLCSSLVAQKIFFILFTTAGEVLSKEDFLNIANNNVNLYKYIATGRCRGYCYSICFEMLKTLRKGHIEIMAVREFFPSKIGGKKFAMHVIYVNNDWAFDTYSACQYPVEELHEIFDARIYKTFDYEDIKDKVYEDFVAENEEELNEWCKNNDYAMFDKKEC